MHLSVNDYRITDEEHRRSSLYNDNCAIDFNMVVSQFPISETGFILENKQYDDCLLINLEDVHLGNKLLTIVFEKKCYY